MKINAAVVTEEQQDVLRPSADDTEMHLETNKMFKY